MLLNGVRKFYVPSFDCLKLTAALACCCREAVAGAAGKGLVLGISLVAEGRDVIEIWLNVRNSEVTMHGGTQGTGIAV